MPQTEQDKQISLRYDPSKNAFVGQIEMMEDMASGVWMPSMLIIYDKSENATYVNRYNTTFDEESKLKVQGR